MLSVAGSLLLFSFRRHLDSLTSDLATEHNALCELSGMHKHGLLLAPVIWFKGSANSEKPTLDISAVCMKHHWGCKS